MLRALSATLATTCAAGGLVLLGSMTAPATAADCGGAAVGCVETEGGNVTVTVTGSLVRGGSAGSTGGSTTVRVPTPCVWYQGWTGKEYFQGVKDGTINCQGSREAENGDWKPFEGYEKYKDLGPEGGYWYFPGCSNSWVPDMSPAEFDAYVEDYFARYDGAFVRPGETPPTPPVPPEILLMAAQEAMEVPEPEFEYNPDASGPFDTLVNMDTWFWLSDPTQEGSVTATAGQNSVTVDATLSDVTFSATNAGAVPCEGTGVEWSQGASSECTLAFDRAGSSEVTADTQWTLTWSFNGTPQGDIDPLSSSFTQPVVVAESQALVNQVG